MRNNKITPESIDRVKYLIKIKAKPEDICKAVGISHFTYGRIKSGLYDTGKLQLPKKTDIYDYSFY